MKMALEIDHRTSIDYNIEFVPFWDRFWDPFGVYFGSFGLQKGARQLELSPFVRLSVKILPPRRLGDPARRDFGTISGPFWELWLSKRRGRVRGIPLRLLVCQNSASETPRRPCPERFWHHFGSILAPFSLRVMIVLLV